MRLRTQSCLTGEMKIVRNSLHSILKGGCIGILAALQAAGLVSCSNSAGELEPAVMLTFDDAYVSDWLGADSLFEKYGAKATFFVTHLHDLDSSDFAGLAFLQSRGHEIGCHGLSHADPITYMDSAGIRAYLVNEVDAAVALLWEKGFEVKSYAFPFGNYTDELCDSIHARGLFMRGAGYNKTDIFHRKLRPLDELDVFLTKKDQQLAVAMGIDSVYNNSMALIAPGIKRCGRDSVALVLYAHRISPSGGEYSVHPALIDSILSFGCAEGVKFKTFSNR